jgi:hypothetical protein
MPDESSKPEPSKKSEPLIEQVKDGGKKLILSFGPAGLALGLAVHFGRLGQWQLAGLLLAGAGVLAIGGKFYKTLEPKIDKLFQWLVDHFERWVRKSWWAITSNFRGKYYQQLIFDCRDYRTQGLKTKGAFTLDLEKVFVPLQVAPESAANISSDMMRVKASERRLGIWDFLAERSKQPSYQRIAIIAPPGAGKTTLLEHLTLTYAQQAHRQQHRQAPALIPVLLYLRTVREEVSVDQPPSLAAVIENRSEIRKLNPNGWFEAQLQRGKCLVLLDGLDEVADEGQRKKVSRWVDQQIQAYPKSCFILTSRPFGYQSAALERIGTVVEVQPFSLKQMQRFIGNWYLQNEIQSRMGKDDAGVRQVARGQANNLIDRIKNSSPLATMAVNPLLLTMIATVHCYRGALPGRRVELYGEICDVLLGRRQDAKGIPDPLTANQKKSILQVLALALMQQNTREFSPQLGCDLIRHKLRMVVGETMQPAIFLEAIANQTGLLIEREKSLYEFAHKSFQEYLAAAEVKETHQEAVLIQNVGQGWWAETIRLYASQQDATQIIQAAQAAGSVAALTLAVECLEEALSVQPEVRKSLEEQLEGGLESSDPQLFRLAAEVKLSRRLNRLLRIDDDREIDMEYIICAEYQLFIDEQRKQGIYRQPDHWQTDRFVAGTANSPITGVRGSDAEEFCQWLSKQNTGQYRLPQCSEVVEHPNAQTTVGSWCVDQTSKRVEGLSLKQLQTWQENWTKNHTRDHVLARDLNLNRVLDRAHVRTLARALDLDCVLAGALARDLDLAFDLAFDLARARDLAHAHARARALARALAHARDLDRAHARTYSTESISEIRPQLFLLAGVWHSLSRSCESNLRGLQAFNLRQRSRYQRLSRVSIENRDAVLQIYALFVLLELRRTGEMPAWEGIRIVRDKRVG